MSARDLRAEALAALAGERWEDSGEFRRAPDPLAAIALALIRIGDSMDLMDDDDPLDVEPAHGMEGHPQ